jgi:hypothetical protein
MIRVIISTTVIFIEMFNIGVLERTERLMFPNISLHTNTIESMLAQESQPSLHRLGISILNLDETAEGDTLEILLALLVHEVASRDGPAFDDTGQRHGSGNGEVEVIRGADGEVGEEFDVLDAVGSELEIADW